MTRKSRQKFLIIVYKSLGRSFLGRFHNAPKFQLQCRFLSNISPDHLHGFIISFLSHALHQCVHIWNFSDFLVKICPFLKLLRSELSNRPRIFRCWINDPYIFQNRSTSWREAISNFGLQRSFPETCRACDRLPCFSILTNCACILMMLSLGPPWSSYVTDFEFLACPSSFFILQFFTWVTNPQHDTIITLPQRSPSKNSGPEDTCSTSAAMVVPSTPPGLLLQRHQDPLREPFQKTPPTVTKLLLAAMEDHGTHCVSTVEVDVFTKGIACLFFTS